MTNVAELRSLRDQPWELLREFEDLRRPGFPALESLAEANRFLILAGLLPPREVEQLVPMKHRTPPRSKRHKTHFPRRLEYYI